MKKIKQNTQVLSKGLSKRLSATEKNTLLVSLNGLENKFKFDRAWDSQVKMLFTNANSYSFEELIHKDRQAAQMLVTLFK
jgi:hypothetical protein